MPKLTVSTPDDGDVVHELSGNTITLGRIEENAIQISDPSVSSRHAQLSDDDGDYVLRDLGSTNGTRLNGREVAEGEDHKLKNGDKIIFGKVTVLYSSERESDSRPMPEEVEVAAVPAAASVRPADFANASPFQTKKAKKDGAGVGILIFSILALLAAAGAAAMVYQMQAPPL